MFQTWLREDTGASWSKLVDALRRPSVGLHALAGEIEKRFVLGKCGLEHVCFFYYLHIIGQN